MEAAITHKIFIGEKIHFFYKSYSFRCGKKGTFYGPCRLLPYQLITNNYNRHKVDVIENKCICFFLQSRQSSSSGWMHTQNTHDSHYPYGWLATRHGRHVSDLWHCTPTGASVKIFTYKHSHFIWSFLHYVELLIVSSQNVQCAMCKC